MAHFLVFMSGLATGAFLTVLGIAFYIYRQEKAEEAKIGQEYDWSQQDRL